MKSCRSLIYLVLPLGCATVACTANTIETLDAAPAGDASYVQHDSAPTSDTGTDAPPPNDASIKLTIEAACAKMHGPGDWTVESGTRWCATDSGRLSLPTMGADSAECVSTMRCYVYVFRAGAVDSLATCYANMTCSTNDLSACGGNLDQEYATNASAADAYLSVAQQKRAVCPNISKDYATRTKGSFWNAVNDDVLAALGDCLKVNNCDKSAECLRNVFHDFAGTRDVTCVKPVEDSGIPDLPDGASKQP